MVSDYGKVLAETDVRTQKMLAAFNSNEYGQGHNQADEIGALYAPDDEFLAECIARLVKNVASAMYFGGIQYQITENAKERERKFSPPF